MLEDSGIYYIRDVVYDRENEVKYLSVISQESLEVQQLSMVKEFYTFVLVFNLDNIQLWISHLDLSYSMMDVGLRMQASNKNLVQCLFDNSNLNPTGSLYQFTTTNFADYIKLNNMFEINSHHVDDFAFNPQVKNLLFTESLRYSLNGRHNGIFNLQTLASTWHQILFNPESLCFEIGPQHEDVNVLNLLPIVGLDLEVIANNDQSFPLGVYEDEQIVTASVVIEYQRSRFYFMFQQIRWQGYDSEISSRYLQEKIKSRHVCIWGYPDEISLLKELFVFLYCGHGLSVFNLNSNVVSIITGYNIKGFDLPYLYKRLKFYGLDLFASKLNLQMGWKEHFFFDLYPLERKYCGNVIGHNFKLDNVAHIFLKQSKVPIKITKIRELYRHEDLDSNSIENAILVDGKWIPSLNYLLYYNTQDVVLVLDLIPRQQFLNLVYLESKEFNKSIASILVQGNNKILASMNNLMLLRARSWFSKTPPHIIVPGLKQLKDVELMKNDPTRWCKILKESDVKSIDLLRLITQVEVNKQMEDNIPLYDDVEAGTILVNQDGERYEGTEKGFGGGANAAKPGCYSRLASVDFTSLYPSIILCMGLDFNNVAVITKEMFLQQQILSISMLLETCHVYVYDQYESVSSFLENVDNRTELTLEICTVAQFSILDSTTRLIIIASHKRAALSDVITELLNKRAHYKALKDVDIMAASQEKMWKTASCSVFGCLGFAKFESAAFCTAAAITHMARRLITQVVVMLHKMGFASFYIDTDGIILQFTRDQSELEKLCHQITTDLQKKYIHLKPEEVYTAGIILRKKKYILLRENGELIVKGWIEHAIKPIKDIVNSWFKKLLQLCVSNEAKSWRFEFDHDELILMLFTQLEDRWMQDLEKFKTDPTAMDCWIQYLKSNPTSPVEKIREFSKEIAVSHNISEEGTRIPVFHLIDGQQRSIFKYVEDQFDLWDYAVDCQSILRNFWNYILSFTACPYPGKADYQECWNKFCMGRRVRHLPIERIAINENNWTDENLVFDLGIENE